MTRDTTDGIRYWVLLGGNRWTVTAVILVAVYGLLIAMSQVGLAPLQRIVADEEGVGFIFTSFVGTIVTGTAIVVTINQLVLSQELGALGDQRERMEQSVAFRKDIEEATGMAVGPTDPAAFIGALAGAIEARARTLEATVDDDALGGEIVDYTESVAADAQRLQQALEGAEFGTFDVVQSALAFDYSQKIHTGRHIRAEYAGTLSEDGIDALEETIELLNFFGPIREHFKTLYFQWNLIELSRGLLYISVPALAVMGVLILYVDGVAVSGTVLGVDTLVWVTAAGFVVGMSPFVVFTVYVLRIATVAKRTLAIGPFVLQRTRNRERE